MVAQNKTKQEPQKYNGLKWLVVVLLVLSGGFVNSYYSQVAVALRAAGWIVLLAVALGVAYFTTQGQQAWAFIGGARAELRKVVWPTRQETMQTSLVVIVMVIVTALVLWGLDSFFLWAVGWLTGQRG